MHSSFNILLTASTTTPPFRSSLAERLVFDLRLTGSAAGTLSVEGSTDGATWSDITASFVFAPGAAAISGLSRVVLSALSNVPVYARLKYTHTSGSGAATVEVGRAEQWQSPTAAAAGNTQLIASTWGRSPMETNAAAATTYGEDELWCTWLGTAAKDLQLNYLRALCVGNNNGGSQAAQMLVLSSPLPPNLAVQSLTVLAVSHAGADSNFKNDAGTTVSLNTVTPVTGLRNINPLALNVASGTHLWAGFWQSNNAGTAAKFVQHINDMGRGMMLRKGAAGASTVGRVVSGMTMLSPTVGTIGNLVFEWTV